LELSLRILFKSESFSLGGVFANLTWIVCNDKWSWKGKFAILGIFRIVALVFKKKVLDLYANIIIVEER
jgi:hypothetical protein